jgi:hypothetical protein
MRWEEIDFASAGSHELMAGKGKGRRKMAGGLAVCLPVLDFLLPLLFHELESAPGRLISIGGM